MPWTHVSIVLFYCPALFGFLHFALLLLLAWTSIVLISLIVLTMGNIFGWRGKRAVARVGGLLFIALSSSRYAVRASRIISSARTERALLQNLPFVSTRK
eukprot:GEMP01169968.1.p1 GENE.GEMP01169968.1~~GEMP01169968.1.p1  ORF type:complete len:100 (-),score=2.11 GEMP01169968.1:23-322(-)